MSETTTIRGRRETRDRLNRLASARGLSAPELIGQLVDRAEDDELFAGHAAAYDALHATDPDLLAEIEDEDRAWERSDLASPIAPGGRSPHSARWGSRPWIRSPATSKPEHAP